MLNIAKVYGLLAHSVSDVSTDTFAQRMKPTTVLVLVTVAYLTDRGCRKITTALVAERCGISPSTARNALSRLARAEWLIRRGNSVHSHWILGV